MNLLRRFFKHPPQSDKSVFAATKPFIGSHTERVYIYVECPSCKQSNRVDTSMLDRSRIAKCAKCHSRLPSKNQTICEDNKPQEYKPGQKSQQACLLCEKKLKQAEIVHIAGVTFCAQCSYEITGTRTPPASSDITTDFSAEYSYLNFEIFPHGPWGTNSKPTMYLSVLDDYKKRFSFQHCDFERLKMIQTLRPKRRVEGPPSWKGYIAFEFENHQKTILECPFDGNATYILRGNWITLSQKSKGELIRMPKHCERIIHSKNWLDNIRKSMRAN